MNRPPVRIACAAAALLPCAVFAQDLAMTAGKNAKVLLDNERVRVIELQMAPGASTGMHSHGENFVYFITGGTASQTAADGSTREMTRKPGEVLWSEPVTHDTRNTGQKTVRTLVVELKDKDK